MEEVIGNYRCNRCGKWHCRPESKETFPALNGNYYGSLCYECHREVCQPICDINPAITSQEKGDGV